MKINMIIKNQKGVAAVEFAIVAPLLILMAFGFCEFGLLLYNKQIITNASRECARAGIVRVSSTDHTENIQNDELKTIVKNYCNSRLIDFGDTDLTDAEIVLNPSSSSARLAAAFGSDFSVTIQYNYKFAIPSFFGLGTTKSIGVLTLMKMEQIPL